MNVSRDGKTNRQPNSPRGTNPGPEDGSLPSALDILAVDDSEDNLVVLQALIREHLPGSNVILASSAREGLQRAAENSIDAAIIDVQMPGMSGIEMVRALKADPTLGNFPILLFTAHYADSRVRVEGLEAGADDFLSKPIDNIELMAKLRVMLRIKQAEDELRDMNARLEELVEQRTHELQESEAKLQQAQKLEAIGRLAGGVAHDFNNILTAIMGNAQLLSLELDNDPECGPLAMQIVQASKQAGDVTRQLLAFARRGRWQEIPVDLHQVIEEVISLLRHTTNRRISIETDLAAESAATLGDPSQLQNALLNLGINACDAMPDGGRLLFQTRIVTDPGRGGKAHTNEPLLEIRVVDTGAGMSEEVLSHLFEPFFTTKDAGKGTGLGLASVYGCIKSHKGFIDVSSELGRGTTFEIRLPLSTARRDEEQARYEPTRVSGSGHVLLVDDEELVRKCAARSLQSMGYRVTECADGQEAVEAFQQDQGGFDLVILDLIMPRVDGREALRRIRQIDPDSRVMISSGYDPEQDEELRELSGSCGVLHKPYQIEELSRKVAEHIKPTPCA
jgi:signal transduction histidine kinase